MNQNKSDDALERPLDLIVRLLRDFCRGFTDSDARTAELKMAGPHRPGAIIPVSKKELNAILAKRSNVELTGGALAPSSDRRERG